MVTTRAGLAQIDMMRGRFARALKSYQGLAAEERAAGWTILAFISELYIAECLGRLGRDSDMERTIVALRCDMKATPFAPSPAMEELFSCLDQGTLDADLVRNVRRHLEGEAHGIQGSHKPLRVVG